MKVFLSPSQADVPMMNALRLYLRGLGVDVSVVCPDEAPSTPFLVMGTRGFTSNWIERHGTRGVLMTDIPVVEYPGLFGRRHMVNHDIRIQPLSKLPTDRAYHVKSANYPGDFKAGVKSIDDIKKELLKRGITEDVEIAFSEKKTIYNESRFFVLDGKIIGQCQYAVNGKMVTDSAVPVPLLLLVKDMVKRINNSDFNKSFVIDLAMFGDMIGNPIPGVVEVNSFSTSGLIAIDVVKFAKEIVAYLSKD